MFQDASESEASEPPLRGGFGFGCFGWFRSAWAFRMFRMAQEGESMGMMQRRKGAAGELEL